MEIGVLWSQPSHSQNCRLQRSAQYLETLSHPRKPPGVRLPEDTQGFQLDILALSLPVIYRSCFPLITCSGLQDSLSTPLPWSILLPRRVCLLETHPCTPASWGPPAVRMEALRFPSVTQLWLLHYHQGDSLTVLGLCWAEV